MTDERFLRRGSSPSGSLVRVLRRGSTRPEGLDVETAFHLLARGAAELVEPTPETYRELERVGQMLLERTARELGDLLISE
ncbi:MAG: hypothetical protein ACRD3V_11250 [Vicinamibacteria bacterium]